MCYNGGMKYLIPSLLLGVVCAACLPARLDKYRNKSGDLGPASSVSAADAVGATTLGAKGAGAGPAAAQAQPQRATIYAVDRQTFRFSLREGDVWDAALNVLLRNYNLTIVDKTSGILTTEWDSYFLNNEVYRNRVSMRIARSSSNSVDMVIHNNVERLRDASQATNAVGAVWLPAEDAASEPARIVQNMALLLNQPPPVLPPNSAVASGKGSDSTLKR